MIELLQNLVWWHWIVGAVALWFAASAAVIGLLLVVLPLPGQWQWVLFAVLGVVAMVWYRNYKKLNPDVDERPMLNLRGQQYIGQQFTLVEPIEQGFGKVRVGDGVWQVAGKDAAAGTAVRVIGVDGVILKVEVQ